MKRILVTGNAGSGKTSLSGQLADSLQLQAHGLDSIVWKSGWKKTPRDEKFGKIQTLIDHDSWIVDGVSDQAFLAADTVIFLDVPLFRCLINMLKRFLRNGFKTRASLPPNCPEYIGVIKAIEVALKYQKTTRTKIIALVHEHKDKKIYWVRNYNELPNVLASLARESSSQGGTEQLHP